MLQWKEDPSDLELKSGKVLCRQLRQAKIGSFHLPDSGRRNTGYFVVLEAGDPDEGQRKYEPGDIFLALAIAGSPIILPDGTSYYYVDIDAEIISNVKRDTRLWAQIQESFEVVKRTDE